MMQSWESYNQIYMATDLQQVPWSPHNMFADMYVARAPWHVIFCWLMGGTGGGGVGAEEGQGRKQVSHPSTPPLVKPIESAECHPLTPSFDNPYHFSTLSLLSFSNPRLSPNPQPVTHTLASTLPFSHPITPTLQFPYHPTSPSHYIHEVKA